LQTAYHAFIDLDDEYYAAWTLHFSAKQISDSQGIEAGIEQLNQVLELRRKHGDQIGAVYSLYNLSTDLLLLGRMEECAAVTEEILSISRVTGERSSLLLAQITMSLLAFLAGRFEDVRNQNEVNHSLASSLNHVLGLAWTNLIQSLIDYFDGKTLSATQFLATSEKMAAQGVVRYFVHITYALMQHADDVTLKRHLLSAAHQADEFAASGAQIWCLAPLAIWEANNGQPIRAAELLALAQKQPASLMGWLPTWLERTSLPAQLEQKSGSEIFADASERGRTLDVPTVIQSFISITTAPKTTVSTIPLPIQEANQQLFEPLSDRELEVLSYIGRGLSNREIANEMVVELSTVKKHLTHVYGKLAVSTRAQAILQAQKLHLI
jgi:ATP/maltotriose-dependent transcriptional regulator MalT